jgi:hypothetical protein
MVYGIYLIASQEVQNQSEPTFSRIYYLTSLASLALGWTMFIIPATLVLSIILYVSLSSTNKEERSHAEVSVNIP